MNRQYQRAENILNKDKCNSNSLDVLESEIKLLLSNYMTVRGVDVAVVRRQKGFSLRIEVDSDGFIGVGKSI